MRRHLLVPLLALPLLAGCSSPADQGIELLDEPATAQDELPSDLHVGGFEPDTVRFAAQVDGLSFYMARAATGDARQSAESDEGLCLIVAEEDHIACAGMPFDVSFYGISARIEADDFEASKLTSEGWDQVQKNLFLKGLDDRGQPGRNG
ncbi:MAG: hypothetical protein ACTHWW_00065 [Arthrobacter sp.]|uniref:hypothetical protein n=1 Tax=unclassified Arthrobacter TaxID=235627 RepID=UPI0026511EE1|nr:hypothetical protein [Micrococcaceae bacterium]MDN5811745.1 hypothetical protein [Micrococcaceae bacterium]MDN5824190.1 hypothetical protein [Micrococcaceae bacterium]MDN5878587.1 hypothetical protein [Micrococcaceae bacterium]MDN5886148.1 hypothetical protein [Micrococcaceae bacterium]